MPETIDRIYLVRTINVRNSNGEPIGDLYTRPVGYVDTSEYVPFLATALAPGPPIDRSPIRSQLRRILRTLTGV